MEKEPQMGGTPEVQKDEFVEQTMAVVQLQNLMTPEFRSKLSEGLSEEEIDSFEMLLTKVRRELE